MLYLKSCFILFLDSTITGVDMNNLLILHLESGDSKNYTCVPTTELVENSKTIKNAYTHYVIGTFIIKMTSRAIGTKIRSRGMILYISLIFSQNTPLVFLYWPEHKVTLT